MNSIENKILHYLGNALHPQTPHEIAQNLKLNPNTVRARLSDLKRKGMVRKEFEHHYVIAVAHGVTPPRVQNLQVSASLPVRIEHKGPPGSGFKESVIKVGDLSVVLQFGFQNQKVNYQVGTPRGLDLDGFRAVHVAVGMQLRIMGYTPPFDEDWTVIQFELLSDYKDVKLEGVKAMTWKALDGTLEKYYNKGDGLRREVRSTREIGVMDLDHLIQGGMRDFQYSQGLNIIRVGLSQLTDSVKGIFYQYRDMQEMFKASQDSNIRLIEAVEKLLKEKKS